MPHQDNLRTYREKRERAERIKRTWLLIIALVEIGLLYAVACHPLPKNLGELAVSDGALVRLHRAATEEARP